MPKFDLDINTADAEWAEGFEAWPEDKLPTTGSYKGKMKIVGVTKTGDKAKNPNRTMFKLGVELVDAGDYTGYVTWRNLVLLENTKPFINQWLRALTDGSDEQYAMILKSFNEGGIRVDEKKENITAIGRWKINSPNGELPVKISLRRKIFENEQTKEIRKSTEINSFLMQSGSSAGGVDEDEPAEEPDTEVPLDVDDEGSVFDAPDDVDSVDVT